MSQRTPPAWLLLLALGAGCAAPPATGSLRYRMPEDPPSLDPYGPGNNNSNVYLYLLFDSLVEFVPGTTQVRPAVAQSWTISPDGRTYTFKLRPGVQFHNGREATSDDVVFSLRRALSREARSAKRGFFGAVTGSEDFWLGRSGDLPGVEAIDEATVAIHLDHPSVSFLSALASEAGSILPREVYSDPSEGYLRRPVGCGPFQLESWEPGVGIRLSRFGDHWNGPGPPGALALMEFRFIKSASTALEEYRAGNLDFTQEVPSARREEILRQMPDHLRNRATLQLFYVGFNHASGPFRENPLLRLAVMHAIDREFIVRVLQAGKDTLANGVIPPGMLGHDESRPGWSKDPRRAAELLAQAGYPGGAGLPELVYISNDTEGFRNLADRLVTDLAAVGIKARISMSDLGAFIAALAPDAGTPPSADLFRMSYYADWPDPDNFLGLQFTGGMTDNFGEYANPAFDDLILLGRREIDPALRESLYREAESILLADAALVPIYWYGEDLLVRPELENVQLSPLGHFAIAWDEVSFRR